MTTEALRRGEEDRAMTTKEATLAAELRETALNLTQTLLAVNIGHKSQAKRLAFVLGQVERIRDRNCATLESLGAAR